jgi:hypothetical protein
LRLELIRESEQGQPKDKNCQPDPEIHLILHGIVSCPLAGCAHHLRGEHRNSRHPR